MNSHAVLIAEIADLKSEVSQWRQKYQASAEREQKLQAELAAAEAKVKERCKMCGARTAAYRFLKDAREAWNRRAPRGEDR